MKCNILPRAVAAPPGTLDAVKNGLADVSFTVHGYTPGRFVLHPDGRVPLPGRHRRADVGGLQQGRDEVPAVRRRSTRACKVLAYFTHGPGIVFNTKRPVTKVEDLQGLKWRVGGGMVNEISKTLGMNVTLKPAPDSYELLSGGVMDGTLFPAESTESFKIDKIIKHATTFPGGLYNTSFVFMMNQAKYDKLSARREEGGGCRSRAKWPRASSAATGTRWTAAPIALMQANNVQITKADAKFVADVKAKTSALEAEVGEGRRGQGPEGRRPRCWPSSAPRSPRPK